MSVVKDVSYCRKYCTPAVPIDIPVGSIYRVVVVHIQSHKERPKEVSNALSAFKAFVSPKVCTY
jgi:hypothetical protein